MMLDKYSSETAFLANVYSIAQHGGNGNKYTKREKTFEHW